MSKKDLYKEDEELENKESEKEMEDENDFEVIAWDDWDFPIEIDWDIQWATTILRITSEEHPNFLIEKENTEPVTNNMVIFSIIWDETENIKPWEYKWSISVVKDDKKKSSKPKCFYVIKN